MCLCFPEFSGKYVYDEYYVFYTAFFCCLLLLSETSQHQKKLFIESFFSDDFFLPKTIFFHPRTQLKPLALIAETEKNSLPLVIDIW